MSVDLAKKVALAQQIVEQNKVFQYEPYGWQKRFHSAGKDHVERMAMAANRVGKTFGGASEFTYHATGKYPGWWDGFRFEHPIIAWCGSPTNETSRDILQAELLGGLGEELGTGTIPKTKIVGKPKMRQAGVSDVVDSVKVRHSSGGLSTCVFKTYEQGWQKWQGKGVHLIWLDEEPSKGSYPTPEDYKIFTESETRILATGGILMVTFTPLYGVTPLVEHFQQGKSDTFLIGATWDDAPHLSEERKQSLKERYPDYEIEARTKGIPMLGEGRVFTVREDDIKIKTRDQYPFPSHFVHIAGCDFGIDHPAAGAWIAWDRDQDIIYLYACYKKKGETPVYHAAEFSKKNNWIPIAWPHDGHQRDKGSGKELYRQYMESGANMLPKSARYAKYPGEQTERGGSQPQEPIVMEVLERMKTGRFKVYEQCSEFWDEFRSYHRKDGKLVSKMDDVLKACFYAVMMKRFAIPRVVPRVRHATRPILA